jgi:hypothetical protein
MVVEEVTLDHHDEYVPIRGGEPFEWPKHLYILRNLPK